MSKRQQPATVTNLTFPEVGCDHASAKAKLRDVLKLSFSVGPFRELTTCSWFLCIDEAVSAARAGDPSARQACLEYAMFEMQAGKPLSPELNKFVCGFLYDATQTRLKGRGRGREPETLRNKLIVFAVKTAAKIYGVRSRRDGAMDDDAETGCSIVSRILTQECGVQLSERGVERIFRLYQRQVNDITDVYPFLPRPPANHD